MYVFQIHATNSNFSPSSHTQAVPRYIAYTGCLRKHDSLLNSLNCLILLCVRLFATKFDTIEKNKKCYIEVIVKFISK